MVSTIWGSEHDPHGTQYGLLLHHYRVTVHAAWQCDIPLQAMSFKDKLEPVDILVLVTVVGGFTLMIVGMAHPNTEVTNSGLIVMTNALSAYLGSKLPRRDSKP